MIHAAVFCPHPPVLIPDVAQGAAGELHELRAACRTAIRQVAALATRLVVIGAGKRWTRHEPVARGSLAPFGVPLEVSLGSDAPGPVELPPALTVGAWLLRDALGPDCGASGWSVGPAGTDGPARLEPDGDAPSALLVMADGSARRSTAAPGYLDERAAGHDARLAAGLRAGDPALLHEDAALAHDLLVQGGPVWDRAATELAGRAWDAQLLYDAAPYGVGYFVATWSVRE